MRRRALRAFAIRPLAARDVTHVANGLSKLQAENRAQAAVQALKRGVISLEELS